MYKMLSSSRDFVPLNNWQRALLGTNENSRRILQTFILISSICPHLYGTSSLWIPEQGLFPWTPLVQALRPFHRLALPRLLKFFQVILNLFDHSGPPLPHQNRLSKSRILAGYQILDFTFLTLLPYLHHWGKHFKIYFIQCMGERSDLGLCPWDWSARYCTNRRERPSLLDLLSEFGLISDGWLGLYISFGDWANALECWRSPSLRLIIPGIAVSPGVTHSDSRIVFVTGTVVKPQQPTNASDVWDKLPVHVSSSSTMPVFGR